ncbi:hypothetical protein [Nocardia altamirensis]|uniref:hypothetical protein n=1 Tax=Nocardia altamirensis TaxID=472158 RepID=UPI00083FF2F0|nr:hypothetical protein [Nocardia altamirensis]
MASRPRIHIHTSALKREFDEADILHALNNAIRTFEDDDGLTMVIGAACNPTLIEVGYVLRDDGSLFVIHTMKARTKYLKRFQKPR